MVKKPCAMFKWHKSFGQGRDILEEDEHTSWERTVTAELKIQEVAKLVHFNCSQMVYEEAAAGISYGTYQKILTDDLNMSHATQQCSDVRSLLQSHEYLR
jgi:hypothetical protein